MATPPSPVPVGIRVVALLMVIFGVAEVVTSFTHDFFGISTTPGALSAWAGAGIGVLYALSGLLIATMRRSGAAQR